MSTKLAWVRCFPSDWISDASGMTSHQISTYMMLILLMYKKREPILENVSILARISGCSVKAFNKALDFLLSDERLIRLKDGRLWSLQVEEELNNSNENLNKFSERAKKAAEARWEKHNKEKTISSDDQDAKNFKHDAKNDACDAITNNTNNTNIYNKKNNTIVLSKKEIDFEDLETEDHDHDVENSSDQIELVADDQTSIHEQSSETSYAGKNLWHIDEKELEKLPSRHYTNSAKSLADVIGDVLPPTIHKQESVTKKSKKRKVKKDFKTLPEDFEPDLQYAIDKGLTHDEALLEFERFKFHWKANPCRNANNRDWQSAWCGWIINQNGTLAKKLEQEKRYANERYKLSTNNFTNSLSESFSTLKTAITTSDSYRSECSRDTEVISSFAKICREGGPECVSSNLYAWKAVDDGGGSASFARL
ncbi:hypothetical protein MEI_01485 [Bartonella vinsonii subsp. arupensis Pm136co]|uniref:Phage related protein n=1 Tax=Bartonella vinsonii subsp. arupensis Pm136co TaxID=1094561 RepID=A0ABN0GN76_BARVI|nr:DUF1376 domain-containing protein [Bartonella vinsonii]EJF96873.1 hypothetical protein MEI_01485 [Bartonella vinsonii subsp. arupensis Pm136co]